MKPVTIHLGPGCPDWLRVGCAGPGIAPVDEAVSADVTCVFPGQESEPRDSPVVLWCSAEPCPPNPHWLAGPLTAMDLRWLPGQLRLIGELLNVARSHRRALDSLANRQRELGVVASISERLSGGYQHHELATHILQEARRITGAEGGSLALVVERRHGRFLDVAVTENEAIAEPLAAGSVPLDERSPVGHVALTGEVLEIADAQDLPADLPYRFDSAFDIRHHYHTISLLVVPLLDRNRRTIAVMQLVNKVRDVNGSRRFAPRPFTRRDRELALFLAAIATPVLESDQLREQIEQVFEGLIQASITAIETRDPATSGHSLRVANGAVALAKAVNATSDGPYAAVEFSEPELRELKVAGLLHDFGKIGVPEHMLTKAEKLYPWGWENLRLRYDTIRLAWRRHASEAQLIGDEASAEHARRQADAVPALLARLEQAKKPALLDEAAAEFLAELAMRSVVDADLGTIPYLTPQEFRALSIRRGSLTDEEREIVESHVLLTHRFLSRIPWSGNLQRVAEFAHGHHEKPDGTGYPRRLAGEQVPLQARILAISDFFDALAAWDRPYKPAVPLDQCLEIMRKEAAANHLDPELVRIFIAKECYSGMQAIIARGIAKHEARRQQSEQFMVRQIDSTR